MRIVIAATVAAAGGLVAAGVLGVATAETPTLPPPRTVSVQGVATEAISQSASAAVATAVYRQGMADAVTDGQAKAQFLASKVGATLGPVQSMVEGGGYIGCAGGNESGNVEYQGEQPDFGSSGVSISATGVSTGVATPRAVPVVHKPVVKHRKSRRKSPTAKKAATAACTLSTQVSLLYTLS
jgi:hypothetical protein